MPASQQYVDSQIILSEADFQKLAARRRAKKKSDKSNQPSQDTNSEFLFSSMPYVDPKRVERSLYRDPMVMIK